MIGIFRRVLVVLGLTTSTTTNTLETYSNTGPTKRKTAYGRYLLRDDKRGWNGERSRL